MLSVVIGLFALITVEVWCWALLYVALGAVPDGSGTLDEDDGEDDAVGVAVSRSHTRRRSVMAPHRIERRPIAVGFARGGGP
jgi:hypothetical protein